MINDGQQLSTVALTVGVWWVVSAYFALSQKEKHGVDFLTPFVFMNITPVMLILFVVISPLSYVLAVKKGWRNYLSRQKTKENKDERT